MEQIIFQIYGTLILTLISFVLPILTIALSSFPDGIKILSQNYKNEQKQVEENIENEMLKKKQGNDKSMDVAFLDKNLKLLKLTKKRVERKLFYLSTNNILSRSLFALGFSLIFFLSSLFFYTNLLIVSYIFMILSIIFLISSLIIFSNSIKTITDASYAVHDMRNSIEEKTLQLLNTIADNGKKDSESLFIKQEQIQITFDEQKIVENKVYSYSVNRSHKIEISLENLSSYIFKTAELGFTFPKEFILEKEEQFLISTTTKEKIIRFKHEYIQSNTKMMEGNMNITFLNKGIFDVDTFVKGENLKNKTIKFKINIID